MDKITIGAAAVGTPNNLIRYRGYIEFWTNDEKLPYKRVWSDKRQLAYETALQDAENMKKESVK